jgi:formamidopyrimidine-DNA glycosylase
VRKFGKMWAVIDPRRLPARGPEPLDAAFNLPKFRGLVQSRSGVIKPLLLNQTFLAGVGNIYADESLWLAKIHPLRKADAYRMQIAALYRSSQSAAQGHRGSGHRCGRRYHRGRLRAARVRARRPAVLSLSSTAA